MVRTFCCWLALVAVGLALASPVAGAARISVLIIDGQNNHGWAATTPVIKEMLEKTGRFTVDVATTPPKPDPKKPMTDEQKKAHQEAWAKFRPDFSKYQAVFCNYNDYGQGESWPEEVQKAFEKYMKDGGGLVVYHAANNAFVNTHWTEWHKMVGLLWGKPDFGVHVAMDDAGKIIRQPKGEGPGAGHGPQHPYEIVIRVKDHPITQGMPEKFMHVKDELYQGQRGPAENMTILATAFASPEFKGTGLHEPMAFTVTYGKGRVFVCMLGHDASSTSDAACTAFLTRGTEWVATGKVTIPLPADLK